MSTSDSTSDTPVSTAAAYSARAGHDPDYLHKIADATRMRLRDILSVCSTPERTLYKQCQAFALFYIHDAEVREDERAAHVTELAQKLYEYIKPAYDRKVAEYEEQINGSAESPGIFKRIDALLFSIDRGYAETPWEECCDDMRKANFREKWQQHAVNTYLRVKQLNEGMMAGTPPPEEPFDALDVARYYAKQALRGEQWMDTAHHMLKEAMDRREGVFAEIFGPDSPYSPVALLAQPNNQITVVTGAMGSGKSVALKKWVDALDDDYRKSLVVLDADYLKQGLAKNAVREGLLEHYTGDETHDESAGTLQSLCKRLGQMAKDPARPSLPHVVMSHIAIGNERLSYILKTQGRIDIHHISVDPDFSWQEARKRGDRPGGRTPKEQDVRDSVQWSAENVLQIIQTAHPNASSNFDCDQLSATANIALHLYERDETTQDAPPVADIYFGENAVYVYDLPAFGRILERARLGAGKAQRQPDSADAFRLNAIDFIRACELDLQVVTRDGQTEKDLFALRPDGKVIFSPDAKKMSWDTEIAPRIMELLTFTGEDSSATHLSEIKAEFDIPERNRAPIPRVDNSELRSHGSARPPNSPPPPPPPGG